MSIFKRRKETDGEMKARLDKSSAFITCLGRYPKSFKELEGHFKSCPACQQRVAHIEKCIRNEYWVTKNPFLERF